MERQDPDASERAQGQYRGGRVRRRCARARAGGVPALTRTVRRGRVRHVVCGPFCTMAVTMDSSLYVWGSGSSAPSGRVHTPPPRPRPGGIGRSGVSVGRG